MSPSSTGPHVKKLDHPQSRAQPAAAATCRARHNDPTPLIPFGSKGRPAWCMGTAKWREPTGEVPIGSEPPGKPGVAGRPPGAGRCRRPPAAAATGRLSTATREHSHPRLDLRADYHGSRVLALQWVTPRRKSWPKTEPGWKRMFGGSRKVLRETVGCGREAGCWSFRPAYRYGYEAGFSCMGRRWEDAEDDLRDRMDRFEGKGPGGSAWEDIKDAVRDAWNSHHRAPQARPRQDERARSRSAHPWRSADRAVHRHKTGRRPPETAALLLFRSGRNNSRISRISIISPSPPLG